MSEATSSHRLPYGVAPPTFRLPDASHVGAVHLQVIDLQRSLSYYEQVLGLRAHGVTSTSVVLSADGDDRPLVTLNTKRGVAPARRGALGLYHFAILLPARSDLGRFASHLASSGLRPGMADHSVSEALYLWDPDGLGIEIYADRPRDGWRRHNRELEMTTDPLDIRSVIAAGRGEAWTRAPRGTTVGHVHLHVGDLEQVRPSTTVHSASTRRSGAIQGRYSWRRAGITTTWGPIHGHRAQPPRSMRRGSSSGNWWFRQPPTSKRQYAMCEKPVTASRTGERASWSQIPGERAFTYAQPPHDFNLKSLCNLKGLAVRARRRKLDFLK